MNIKNSIKTILLLGVLVITGCSDTSLSGSSSGNVTKPIVESSNTTTVSVVPDDYTAPFEFDYKYNKTSEEGVNAYSYVELYEKVRSQVVTVFAIHEKSTAMGSGVIFASDTDDVKHTTSILLLTNQHVIDGGLKYEVLFANNYRMAGHLIASDSYFDTAILRVDGITFDVNVATLGDSDNLKIGQDIATLGTPVNVNYAGSYTKGIVSNLNISISVDDSDMYLIQIDAAINPGNSGGPLYDMYGRVIGINTLKVTSYKVDAMGFSIPINTFMMVADRIYKTGQFNRPIVGIQIATIQYLSLDKRIELGIADGVVTGLFITEITEGGAASEALVPNNCYILELNEVSVNNMVEFRAELFKHAPGDSIKIKVKLLSDEVVEYSLILKGTIVSEKQEG